MSVIVTQDDKALLICKGAPEEMLKVTVHDADYISKANAVYEALSTDGFRVLAIATKETAGLQRYSKTDEKDLTLQGFIAFLDPPKEDAGTVMTELARIGVEVKIITGTIIWLPKNLQRNRSAGKGIMQGHELEHMTDDALHTRVLSTTIFSRFSPIKKPDHFIPKEVPARRWLYGRRYQRCALFKTADIGISVSNATDVAKDVADIILMRKDLVVLKEGILEGRKTFGNTMKYILMGLSSNFGNMFSVAAATVFLPFLPMLPVQILLNNFIYDTSQLTIPTDNVDEAYIQNHSAGTCR